ncbi:MAG: TolC family protein [Deltaproteobacteria bacterium]|nr:TolC family protein [Deltaproteobacteria bacterium]
MSRLEKISAAVMLSLFLWSFTPSAPAAEPAGLGELEKKLAEGASVADLVNYAYKTNAMIQAARQSWKGVIERYRVETAYPDPELGFSAYPKPLMATYEVMISQMIPFPGKLSQMGEVVKAEIEMARLELDRALRDTIVGIRESYHELFYIMEAKKVVALNRNLLEHLRKVGETAYAQDRVTFFDMVKAQSQLAQLQYDAVLLEELEQTEKAQLNSLLNRPPRSDLKLSEGEPLPPLVYNLEEIYDLARKNREEIRLAEVEINKARAKMGVARYEYLPDFRLGASYAQGNPDMVPEAFRESVGVQFGITIPLWFNKNRGRLEAARAEEQKAVSMKTAQINEANAMIRNSYFRLKNSDRLIRLYRDQLLPQAAKAMEIAETWFREKQGSFTDFIETQSAYYNFQLSLTRAKADYGRNLAQLEKLAGVSLTTNGENGGGGREPKEGGR